MKHTAAIIGVGRIGSRFDEEPGRKHPWSHAGAYLALSDRFDLVAVCDVDQQNIKAFNKRFPGVPVYHTPDVMLAENPASVISIATPANLHASGIKVAIASGARAIWCEKPLTATAVDTQELVSVVEGAEAQFFVSYVRRWMPLWIKAKDYVESGCIGDIRSIRISIPGRFHTMGSHGIDLLSFLGGKGRCVSAKMIDSLYENDEDTITAMYQFDDGYYGMLLPTGFRRNLVVEAEVFGEKGRIRVIEGQNELRIDEFGASEHYEGYFELQPAAKEYADGMSSSSPFVSIATDIADYLDGLPVAKRCGLNEALIVQDMMEQAQNAVS